MKKLSAEFLASVNPAFACMNELVVLPESGDCGFVEYFDQKAEVVSSRKEIYSVVDSQSKLMLEYPEPDCKVEGVFELFFESPSAVARNQRFEGLFGIDISNYVGNLDHDRFGELLTYIKNNPGIVFVLFFYSDEPKEADRVHKMLTCHIDIVKTVLPAPAPTQLLAYTMEGIMKLCRSPEEEVEKFLGEFYEKNAVGYDSADYLLRHLKLSGFKGSVKEIKEMMTVLDISSANGDRYSGLGY